MALELEHNDIHDYCRKFCDCASFRELVLGTTHFATDLCAALSLSLDVTTTSLLFLQQFINSFDVYGLELPLVCGACVLLSWKYWEDFDNQLRSVRKLNDICRHTFKLLMCSIDDSEDEGDEENHYRESKISTMTGSIENTSSMKCSTERESSTEERNMSSKTSLDWRCQLEPLSGTSWTFRDEGKELNRLKDRIKLYESSLLRCIDFEVGPVLLPLDEVATLSQILWISEMERDTSKRHREDDTGFSSTRKKAKHSEVENNEEITSITNCSLIERSSKPSGIDDNADTSTDCPTNRSDDDQPHRETKRLTEHSDDIHIATDNGEKTPVQSPDLDPPQNQLNSGLPQLTSGLPQQNQQDGKFSSKIRRLEELLSCAQSHVVDYYRSPFCLLHDPISIGIAAVWKASIISGFYYPNTKDIIHRITSGCSIAAKTEESSNESTHQSMQLVSMYFSDFSRFIELLQRFRQLYRWMADAEIKRELEIQKLRRHKC